MASQSVRTAIKLLAAVAVLVAVHVYGHDARPGAIAGPATGRATPVTATLLFAGGSCWRKRVPSDMVGEIPPRALVALPGKAPRLVGAGVGFDVWQGKRRGTLYGFCR